jgi:hypothetical protein
MRILINKEKLEQIQRGDLEDNVFANASISPAALIREILNGPPACYLLSGYRGAGKSTYIKALERQASKEASDAIIFVSVDFSRHNKNMNLFRWLIRCLYEAIEPSLRNSTSSSTPTRSPKIPAETMAILKDLNGRTYSDYSQTETATSSIKKSLETTADLVKYGLLLGSLLSLCLLGLDASFQWLSPRMSLMIGAAIPALTTITSWLSIKALRAKASSIEATATRKTLFDDEIADHRFLQLVKLLSAKKIKLVFVLEEMDKIENDQLDILLISLKPYLLCGHASFIVVAGQQLYYKYRLTHTENDAILSSLFARIIHVSLLTPDELRNLFTSVTRIERDPDETESSQADQALQHFITHLLFQSRCIPRSFLLLLRRAVTWSDTGEGILRLPDNPSADERRWFGVIDQLTRDTIYGEGLEAGERDYLIVELFINCSQILRKNLEIYDTDSFYPPGKRPASAKDSLKGFQIHLLKYLRYFTGEMLKEFEKSVPPRAPDLQLQVKFGEHIATAIENEDEWEIVRRLSELRNLVFAVSKQLSYIQQSEIATKNFSELLDQLSAREAFHASFLANGEAKALLDQAHLLMGSPEARKMLSANLGLHGIKPDEINIPLLTFFCCTRAEQLLYGDGYRPQKENAGSGNIYYLHTSSCWKTKLHFTVALRRGETVTDRQLWSACIQDAMRFLDREFLFLVQFCDKQGLERETLQLQFAELARDLDKEWLWVEQIQLILVEINELKGLDSGIQTFIQRQIVREFQHAFVAQPPPGAFPERNDAEYPDPIDFRKYRLRIRITPDDTEYWRFGLRFLPDNTRPARNQQRHANREIGDVVACIGEADKMNDGKHEWHNPTQLDLSWHNTKPLPASGHSRLAYDKLPVVIDYLYDPTEDKGMVTVTLSDSSRFIQREFDMKPYKAVLLTAWCEDRQFRLVTEVTLKRYIR